MKIKIFSVDSNPVGESQKVDVIDEYIEALIAHWNANVVDQDTPWYKKWWRKTDLYSVTKYLLFSLDQFIHMVDDIIEKSADKKATVLAAAEKVYDFVIREAIPWWLRPISGKVKDVILNVVISSSIDWIVEKYRSGDWRKKIEDVVHGDEHVENPGEAVS